MTKPNKPDSNLPAIPERSSGLVLYQTADGQTRVQVRLFERTVWLSQKLMAELFDKSVKTVNEHLRNIYDEGELEPEATIRKFRIVQPEGSRMVKRLVDFYNLDMILAVGYLVHCPRGTRFRQWPTGTSSSTIRTTRTSLRSGTRATSLTAASQRRPAKGRDTIASSSFNIRECAMQSGTCRRHEVCHEDRGST